jgi:hypothetical protein
LNIVRINVIMTVFIYHDSFNPSILKGRVSNFETKRSLSLAEGIVSFGSLIALTARPDEFIQGQVLHSLLWVETNHSRLFFNKENGLQWFYWDDNEEEIVMIKLSHIYREIYRVPWSSAGTCTDFECLLLSFEQKQKTRAQVYRRVKWGL